MSFICLFDDFSSVCYLKNLSELNWKISTNANGKLPTFSSTKPSVTCTSRKKEIWFSLNPPKKFVWVFPSSKKRKQWGKSNKNNSKGNKSSKKENKISFYIFYFTAEKENDINHPHFDYFFCARFIMLYFFVLSRDVRFHCCCGCYDTLGRFEKKRDWPIEL